MQVDLQLMGVGLRFCSASLSVRDACLRDGRPRLCAKGGVLKLGAEGLLHPLQFGLMGRSGITDLVRGVQARSGDPLARLPLGCGHPLGGSHVVGASCQTRSSRC